MQPMRVLAHELLSKSTLLPYMSINLETTTDIHR